MQNFMQFTLTLTLLATRALAIDLGSLKHSTRLTKPLLSKGVGSAHVWEGGRCFFGPQLIEDRDIVNNIFSLK